MPSNYDSIRADNIREYGEGTRHLSFLGRLYTDRTHFIFELLQNAEDAGATKILFELFEDRLEVKHNGRPFNERDVRGVCGVGEGTKAEDLTKIGTFGVGFKSVYAYTITPEIHSADEHFYIEHYVRPHQTDSKSSESSDVTLFVFPFNRDEPKADNTVKEIAERLRNLTARTLLFLRNIKEIKYKLPDYTDGVYTREPDSCNQARQVIVIGQSNGQDEKESWLVFERLVSTPDNSDKVPVEIAFKFEINDETKNIVRVNKSPLVVYFPTEKETKFGFLVQGPYKTTPARDNIPKDNDWNIKLINETAILLVDALQSLKEMGLLTVALLNALPIRMDDYQEDDMFYPIVESVRNTFLDQELLPTDDGTFVSARKAKLASAEWLRLLLRDEQLSQLFKTEDTLKWVSGEVTERAKHDLWRYIREGLKVEEITSGSFARKVDKCFFENQTDDWMASFYKQLAERPALWKQGGSSQSDKAGAFRAIPIIRLQDNSHVMPFRDVDSPNAYLPPEGETELPVVKRKISKDEGALEFLNKLGLTKPDIFADIRDYIIPKYAQYSLQGKSMSLQERLALLRGKKRAAPEIEHRNKNIPPISDDEHMRDMNKILQAYSTAKKNELLGLLNSTAFIRAENNVLQKVEYKKPGQLYFQSDNMLLYFDGNKNVWFVNSEYDSSFHEMFNAIGVVDKVRIICQSENYSLENVKLNPETNPYVYRRGLKGFDPDIQVAELEHAVMNPSEERSKFIWNAIAMKYSHCIKGKVLRCSRQDFSPNANTHEEKNMISNFGNLLMNNRWLPDKQGGFHKPSELKLNDLPESFERDEKLASQLGMNDVVAKLAEVGISQDTLNLVRKLERQPPEVLQKIELLMQEGGQEKPDEMETVLSKVDYNDELRKSFNRTGETEIQNQVIDEGKVKKPEHRREKSYEGHKKRLHDEPNPDERRKKATQTILEGPDEQVREYLVQWYEGKCQICDKTFPERNGQPFFVANYIVSRTVARFVDNPANALCLCADHFAKWQHGAVEADNIQEQISAFKTEAESEGKNTSSILRVKLCGEDCEIKFKEKHLLDLQELLRTSNSHE